MIRAQSRTASVTFDGHTVTITRHGSPYLPDGSRSIPISQISAIRWSNAGRWTGGGYIRFVIAGTIERQYSQTAVLKTGPLKDENTVPFSHKTQPQYEALRAAIEQAIAQLQRGGQPAAVGGSIAEEIAKLAELLRLGAITREEFEQAKARLLG
ncbi:DUF4429 domain-containing protein [Kitasatospora sp. NBC_01302]|uniref:DUF4429 domain-containing protein n=1 Tax=Kitasatospora sp. NBC_01302 TaxID=2903575 RepID=UPI002E10A8F2|nr:DUF4429 domain-containing protein [Kitasatospora sp. NBC_01302]